MKDYKNIGLLLLTVAFSLPACKSYDFEQEFYRKEIYLLGEGSHRVYERQSVDMRDQDTDKGAILNLVAMVSGSQKTSEDYPVHLVKSDSMLKAHNKSKYDIDFDRYALALPEECYEEPKLQDVIPACEWSVKFPFRIKNLDRLIPDKEYFLNYRIDPELEKTVAMNNKGKHVLVRVHWHNEFAATNRNISYAYTNTQVVDLVDATVSAPSNSLRAYPVGVNEVRFLAGNEEEGNNANKDPRQRQQRSLVVTVGEQTPANAKQRFVTLRPYDSKHMEIEMLNPIGEYNNTIYLREDNANGGISTFYKEFRLHYKYRLLNPQANGENKPGNWKEVKANLRHEYNPRAELL